MKKYLYLLLLALVPAMTFTACGNEKIDNPKFVGLFDKDEELDPDDIEISKPTLKDEGNKITFSYSTAYGTMTCLYTEVYKFENNKLVGVDVNVSMPNEELAKALVEELKAQSEVYANVTRKGKTVTYTQLVDAEDAQTKEEVLTYLQLRVDERDHMRQK